MKRVWRVMKAELVNLVANGGTEIVVALSTETVEATTEEVAAALDVAVGLVDEGWRVGTFVGSPLSEIVRRGVQAMEGRYVTINDDAVLDTRPMCLAPATARAR
jgi:hypothetical protein